MGQPAVHAGVGSGAPQWRAADRTHQQTHTHFGEIAQTIDCLLAVAGTLQVCTVGLLLHALGPSYCSAAMVMPSDHEHLSRRRS